MHNILKRNNYGYSLIETMTVIAVIAIVLGLLFAYQDQGWKLFYQSSTRGLSQIKAKIAIRILQEDLREANRQRIAIGRGTTFGVPFPDDIKDSSPYMYFTKPKFYEPTGDIIGYEYVLYYFASPRQTFEENFTRRRRKEKENYLILKSIRFLNQSKFYTEDSEKIWPFLPPLLELQKSNLPEDKAYQESIQESTTEENPEGTNNEEQITKPKIVEDDEFLDHFARLKKESRNIPVSGNFTASSLTDPFTNEEVSISFSQDYKQDKPVKIKVSIEEPPVWFGLMSFITSFEVKVTPRN